MKSYGSNYIAHLYDGALSGFLILRINILKPRGGIYFCVSYANATLRYLTLRTWTLFFLSEKAEYIFHQQE